MNGRRPVDYLRSPRFWLMLLLKIGGAAAVFGLGDALGVDDSWWQVLVIAGVFVWWGLVDSVMGPVLPDPKAEWLGGGAAELELTDLGPRRLDVLKQLREHAGMTYQEAATLTRHLPARFRLGATAEEAEAGRAALEQAGAAVVVVSPPTTAEGESTDRPG